MKRRSKRSSREGPPHVRRFPIALTTQPGGELADPKLAHGNGGPSSRKKGIEALLIFIFIFLIYVMSPIITSGDSHFVIPTALSMVHHGDANIDEYRRLFHEAPWAVQYFRGHFYSAYPIGVPFMAYPFVLLWDRAEAMLGVDLEAASIARAPLRLELAMASLFTAAATALLFFYCRGRLSFCRSLLLTFLFAFGTSAYSSASRAMWPHGPSMLLFLGAIVVFDRLARWMWPGAVMVGLLAGFSFGVRPSNLIVIAFFAALVGLANWRWLPAYLCGAIAGFAPIGAFHLHTYGMVLSPYYKLTMGALSAPIRLKALYGLLFSPSRGLFVFSPFLLFVLTRIGPSLSIFKKSLWRSLEIALGVLVTAWWIGTAKWALWWGGGSFGARLLCELVPCLVILLIPVVGALSFRASDGQKAFTVGFLILGALSVAIHLRAATTKDVWEWNAAPVSVDVAPQRVWSWRDPQFLRGLLHLSNY